MIVLGRVHNFCGLDQDSFGGTFALGHPMSGQILANGSYPKLAQVVHWFTCFRNGHAWACLETQGANWEQSTKSFDWKKVTNTAVQSFGQAMVSGRLYHVITIMFWSRRCLLVTFNFACACRVFVLVFCLVP